MEAFLALLAIDLKLTWRNRTVLFFNLLFPLMFLFLFAPLSYVKEPNIIPLLVTMVTVIGVLGNGLFGTGVRAVQEREANILRRYKVTPITPLPLLVASMVTGVLLFFPTLAVILVLANRVYGMAMPANVLSLFGFVAIGTLAFRAIGSTVAAVVNSSQEAQVVTQLLYTPMLLLSGATIPLSTFPNWLKIITHFIPATYLMSGVAGILQNGETLAENWRSVLALLTSTGVGLFIATKLFRWEKEEKLRPAAKLWVVAVLVPFFALGIYQAGSHHELRHPSRFLRHSASP